jgi:hypothetical protein
VFIPGASVAVMALAIFTDSIMIRTSFFPSFSLRKGTSEGWAAWNLPPMTRADLFSLNNRGTKDFSDRTIKGPTEHCGHTYKVPAPQTKLENLRRPQRLACAHILAANAV